MKKLAYMAFAALLFLWLSCTVEPEKIHYGSEACQFCKMTIVDRQHAAQYVTKKGKQFKFDAIECMVNDLSDQEVEKIALLLVADYEEPGKMIPASQATFLISKEIKSPMGANLSAFSSEQATKLAKNKNGGEIYAWPELLKKFDAE